MAFESLQDGLSSTIGEVSEFVSEHPIGVALGTAGVVAAGVGIVALSSVGSKTKAKRKTRKKIKHTSRGWKADRARRSKQKWEVAYQRRKAKKNRKKYRKSSYSRRKSSMGKRVKYTKKGQPYIILNSGKARFIKKTKRRHK